MFLILQTVKWNELIKGSGVHDCLTRRFEFFNRLTTGGRENAYYSALNIVKTIL